MARPQKPESLSIHTPLLPLDETSHVLQMEMEELSEAFLPSKHSLFLTLSRMPRAHLAKASRWDLLASQYEQAAKGVRHFEVLVPYLLEEGLGTVSASSVKSETFFHWVSDKLAMQAKEFQSDPRPQTQRFLRTVRKLYGQGVGAWCFISMVERDWMLAFESALQPHFLGQSLRNELHSSVKASLPRYSRCMGLNAASLVVSNRPHLLDETLKQAREMAAGLDDLWNDFQSLLLEPTHSSRR